MDNLGDNMEALFDNFVQDDDNLNKSVKEQIASVKEALELIKENISRMKKDLEKNEYYKSSAGAADYERVRDSIAAMQDTAEDLQNELSELITNALEKGEIKEEDLESLLNMMYIAHQN